MQNGLAIIEKTDTTTKGFYIDQDALECARLNALTKKHTEKAETEQRYAIAQYRKKAKAIARRKAYSSKSAASVAALLAVSGAVCAAGTAGMIHPAIWVSTHLICLCAACIRLGAWFGRVAK